MRGRTLIVGAAVLAAAAAGAWTLGLFAGQGAGPAPAGDEGEDSGVRAAGLSTGAVKPAGTAPAEAPAPEGRVDAGGTLDLEPKPK